MTIIVFEPASDIVCLLSPNNRHLGEVVPAERAGCLLRLDVAGRPLLYDPKIMYPAIYVSRKHRSQQGYFWLAFEHVRFWLG